MYCNSGEERCFDKEAEVLQQLVTMEGWIAIASYIQDDFS